MKTGLAEAITCAYRKRRGLGYWGFGNQSNRGTAIELEKSIFEKLL
jgi:hypothetical protein